MRISKIAPHRALCHGGLVLLGLLAAPGTGQAQPKAAAPPAQKPQSSAVLPGGNGKQPINIQSETLDYFDKEQKLIYTGKVIAVQGESKLKCSVLTIYLPPKTDGQQSSTPSSTSQVQHMDAVGPVTLVSKDQVGTGDHGVYDKVSDTVVLTGNVTLSQGPNVTKGDKLVYNLKSSQAKVTGAHVVSMFQPADSTDPAPKK
jgi:lipopolysaccharide export system protein LptA